MIAFQTALRRGAITFLLAMLALSPTAYAGRGCNERALSPESVRNGLVLAHKTSQILDEAQADVVILGRAGANLDKHGLRYSHAGVAHRDPGTNQWRVVHLLNHCGRADSDLFDNGLGNFFLDDLYRIEGVALVPTPAMQARLRAALSGGLPRRLHHGEYSMIANPWSVRYQNSNQWLLEWIAAAQMESPSTADRPSVQAWLKQNAFAPSRITISTLERLGSRMFRANMRFDDHDSANFDGRFQVVSVEALMAFVSRIDTGSRLVTLTL